MSFQRDNPDDADIKYDVDLYDSNEEEIYEWGSSNKSSFSTWGIGLPAGTYYLRIRSYYSDGTTYSFAVSYKQSTVWEKELNNERADCTLITLNTKWHGASQGRTDKDWYKFTLEKDTKIQIDFTREEADDTDIKYDIDLYNASENTICELSGNSEKLRSNTIGLSAGTYYLRICNYYNSGTEYSFKISEDLAPATPLVTSLKAGKKKAMVRWSKSSGATGYQVYYRLKGGTWKSAAKLGASKTSYTKTKLKKGKTYQFKVCAYKVVDDTTYYSSWSSTKSVKVK